MALKVVWRGRRLSKSNSVNACCAVGVADKSYSQGRLPIVYVIKSESELFELCRKELPEYAQPIDFIFIDVLPLTPIGKVDYRALEEMAKEEKIEYVHQR